jgi:hypothetical protein
MPNLEYSVKFVLASNATSEVDNVITKMSRSGSTITVKINADTSNVKKELQSVEAEIKQYEKTNERLAGSTAKTSKEFQQLSQQIKNASTQIRATGVFDDIRKNVDLYGQSLEKSNQDTSEYYNLLLQLKNAHKQVEIEARKSSAQSIDSIKQQKIQAREAKQEIRDRERAEKEVQRTVRAEQAETRRAEKEAIREARFLSSQRAKEEKAQAMEARRLANEALRAEKESAREVERAARQAIALEKQVASEKQNATRDQMRQRSLEARSITINQKLFISSVRAQIDELRLLSAQGRGTQAQIERLFQRPAKDAKAQIVTMQDMNKVFIDLRSSVQSASIPIERQQQLLVQLAIAQKGVATNIRNVNRSLAQQGEGVGEVSYAMLSFSRLLEDTPYGFRGFANNIQPTIFGLLQLNGYTQDLAVRFEKLNGRALPVATRMFKNFQLSLKGPVNQLILAVSVFAVVGTVLEQVAQRTRKAKEESTRFADELTRLFEVAKKSGNALSFANKQELTNLEAYSSALKVITSEIENRVVNQRALNGASSIGVGRTNEERASQNALLKTEMTRLARAQGLSESVKKRLDDLKVEAEVLDLINQSEYARQLLNLAQLRSREASALTEVANLEDQIKIEQIRQQKGEEASIVAKRDLAIERLKSDELATQADLDKINLQYKLDILNLTKNTKEETKEITKEYESIALALRRQLEDEQDMFSLQRSRIDREREIADLRAQFAEREKAGEDITEAQEKAAIKLIEDRYDIIDKRSVESSNKIVSDLAQQAMMTQRMLSIEQQRLLLGDGSVVALEYEIMELEYQKELREAINTLSKDQLADETAIANALALSAENAKAQYELRLQDRLLRASQGVDEFLIPEDPNILGIEQDRDNALISQEESYYARLAQLRLQYGKDSEMFRQEEAKLTEENGKKRVEITEFAEKQIAFVKYKYATDGIMMVSGALEQLVSGMEAKNKRQFEQQKMLSIGLATMNAYLAVSQVLRDPTIVPSWMKYPMAAAMLVQGLAQVNSIRNTKYGGAGASGGVRGGRPTQQQQGFQEVPSTRSAMDGATSTMRNERAIVQVSVTGNVDREGIAFAVREGENSISSRATFAR